MRALSRLDKIDELKDLDEEEQKIAEEYKAAFSAFNDVRIYSFGQKRRRGYKRKIRRFQDRYLDLCNPITVKVHYVFVHVAQFLEKQPDNVGLGFFSEQESESFHSVFGMHQENFNVKRKDSELYHEQLLQSCVSFCGRAK